MKAGILSALLTLTVATTLSAQAAPRVTTTLEPADLATLERVRKSVWVDWFSGDTAGLRRTLGPELVAMGTGTTYWQTLDEVIASSARFRASGAKFVAVSFDSARVHRFGEAVVMFSRYTISVQNPDGATSTRHGRATEVFVRANRRWVHTSWQLDSDPPPAASAGAAHEVVTTGLTKRRKAKTAPR